MVHGILFADRLIKLSPAQVRACCWWLSATTTEVHCYLRLLPWISVSAVILLNQSVKFDQISSSRSGDILLTNKNKPDVLVYLSHRFTQPKVTDQTGNPSREADRCFKVCRQPIRSGFSCPALKRQQRRAGPGLTCWCRDAPRPAEPTAAGGKPGWCNIQAPGSGTASPGKLFLSLSPSLCEEEGQPQTL